MKPEKNMNTHKARELNQESITVPARLAMTCYTPPSWSPRWLGGLLKKLSWKKQGRRAENQKRREFLEPLPKMEEGAAPAPPNGVRISEIPYGGGDRIP